jgi:hypothetical protein
VKCRSVAVRARQAVFLFFHQKNLNPRGKIFQSKDAMSFKDSHNIHSLSPTNLGTDRYKVTLKRKCLPLCMQPLSASVETAQPSSNSLGSGVSFSCLSPQRSKPRPHAIHSTARVSNTLKAHNEACFQKSRESHSRCESFFSFLAARS